MTGSRKQESGLDISRVRPSITGGSDHRKAYMQPSALASPLDGNVANHIVHWRGTALQYSLQCRITLGIVVYSSLWVSQEEFVRSFRLFRYTV